MKMSKGDSVGTADGGSDRSQDAAANFRAGEAAVLAGRKPEVAIPGTLIIENCGVAFGSWQHTTLGMHRAEVLH